MLVGVALLSIGALVATMVAVNKGQEAVHQRQAAEEQRNEAVALSLASAARDMADSNAALALALAAESSTATPSPLAQTTAALLRARLAFDQSPAQAVGDPLDGAAGRIRPGAVSRAGNPMSIPRIAFSPEGLLLAAAGRGGVTLWNSATGSPANVQLNQSPARCTRWTSIRGSPCWPREVRTGSGYGTLGLAAPQTCRPTDPPARRTPCTSTNAGPCWPREVRTGQVVEPRNRGSRSQAVARTRRRCYLDRVQPQWGFHRSR